MQINDYILPYLAGFFDGEGCIMITMKKNRRKFYVRATCGNTWEEPLLHFVRLFGGTIEKKMMGKKSRRPVYYWQSTYEGADKALRALLPYLIIKHERAKLAIEFREKQKQARPWKKLSDEDMKYREDVRMTMHVLNREHNSRCKLLN